MSVFEHGLPNALENPGVGLKCFGDMAMGTKESDGPVKKVLQFFPWYQILQTLGVIRRSKNHEISKLSAS